MNPSIVPACVLVGTPCPKKISHAGPCGRIDSACAKTSARCGRECSDDRGHSGGPERRPSISVAGQIDWLPQQQRHEPLGRRSAEADRSKPDGCWKRGPGPSARTRYRENGAAPIDRFSGFATGSPVASRGRAGLRSERLAGDEGRVSKVVDKPPAGIRADMRHPISRLLPVVNWPVLPGASGFVANAVSLSTTPSSVMSTTSALNVTARSTFRKLPRARARSMWSRVHEPSRHSFERAGLLDADDRHGSESLEVRPPWPATLVGAPARAAHRTRESATAFLVTEAEHVDGQSLHNAK